MGFLNLFNKKSDNGAKLSVSLPVIEPSEAKEEIKSVEKLLQHLQMKKSL